MIVEITSAYVVFHAEGLTGIELRYAAQLTVRAVRGLRTTVITFLLPNQPYPLSIDLLLMFSPLLATTLLGCYACSLLNRCYLSAGRLHHSARCWLYCTCMQAMPRQQEICCNPVALHTYIHTYIRGVSVQHD